MTGYNVFFHVEHSKKPYNSTEFYPDYKQAQKRALELSIASNVTLIRIFTIDFTIENTEIIKEPISKELKLDLEMSRSLFSLEHKHFDSLCISCKKIHKNANIELSCEGCPNATVEE